MKVVLSQIHARVSWNLWSISQFSSRRPSCTRQSTARSWPYLYRHCADLFKIPHKARVGRVIANALCETMDITRSSPSVGGLPDMCESKEKSLRPFKTHPRKSLAVRRLKPTFKERAFDGQAVAWSHCGRSQWQVKIAKVLGPILPGNCRPSSSVWCQALRFRIISQASRNHSLWHWYIMLCKTPWENTSCWALKTPYLASTRWIFSCISLYIVNHIITFYLAFDLLFIFIMNSSSDHLELHTYDHRSEKFDQPRSECHERVSVVRRLIHGWTYQTYPSELFVNRWIGCEVDIIDRITFPSCFSVCARSQWDLAPRQ